MRARTRCLGLAAWLLAALLPGGLAGQEARLRGVVSDGDTGAPVEGATVLIEGTGFRDITGTDGRFELAGVPPGAHRLLIVAGDFRNRVETVTVAPGESTELVVTLLRPVFEVPDLVVTANRGVTRPGDAPVSVAVMSGDEIRGRNVVSLAEALPFAQGVIFNSGQMDIRGATGLARGVGSRVLMLLDGQRVLSGVGASIEFDALPVLDVERVEIVKGPHSTLYGTNALGGVVNVITKRPPREPETIVRVYYGLFDTPSDLDFTDERLNMQGINLQHSRRFGDLGATLFVGREESDGFRQNGKLDRWRLRAKTVFPVASANPWELQVNWTREDAEEFFTWRSEDRPLEVDPDELGDWTRQDDLSVGITANPIVTPDLHLQIRPQIYHTRVRNFFHDNDDFHRSTRYGTDVQLTTYPGTNQTLTFGGEGAYTGVTSNFLSEDPAVTDLAAFAQDEIVFSDRVRGSVGLRLDYHKASSAAEDVAVNPKLGVVYQPDDRVSLRASVSRGYRAPSVSEQFTSTTVFGFRVIPNLELAGESAWAAEVGATATIGDRLWLDAGAFWSEYRDLIEPSPVQGEFFTFQFQNVAAATVRGLDAGVRFALWPDVVHLRTNYVFLDTEDSRTNRALPYRSRHNLTTTLTGWEDRVAIDVRYRSRVAEVLAFPLDPRGDIALVDLRLSHRILGAEVQAKVENLFQNEYVDVQERSPGQTRTFRLTVTPHF